MFKIINVRVNTFDIETVLVNKVQVISAAGSVDSEKLLLYTGKNALEKLLYFFFYSKNVVHTRISFISHNFSHFDSYFVVKILKMWNITIDKLYLRGSGIIFLRCKLGNRVITFYDSFLFYPHSLSAIMGLVGFNKNFTEYQTKKNFLLYLIFDIISLYYFCMTLHCFFSRVYGLFFLNYISMAQIAYAIYTKQFLVNYIQILPTKYKLIINDGYKVPGIEIRHQQTIFGIHYDVNSLYPYAMFQPMPTDLLKVQKNGTLKFGFGVVNILRSPKAINISFYKLKGPLVLFSEELKYYQKLGYVFEIIESYEFASKLLFTAFVNHFFFLRKYSGNKFLKINSKAILNSLYGKFATKTNPRNLLQLSVAINSYAKV